MFTHYPQTLTMNCIMGYSQIFKNVLVFTLLTLYNHVSAEDDPPYGFHGEERVALLALMATFNNPVLTRSWKSIMCYMNNTPEWYGIQCSNGRVTGILLENLGLTGELKADALFNLTALSVLSFKNNSISGNLMNFSYNKRLRKIDLSSNNFGGDISSSLLSLRYLESLQLQDNNLNGSIPSFNQSSLREFNVSNNHLYGEIPNGQPLQSFKYEESYSGNDLCGPPSPQVCAASDHSSSGDDSSGNKKKFRYAFILAVVDVIGLIVIAILFYVFFKKNRRLNKEIRRMNLVQKEEEKDEKKMEDKGKRVDDEEEKEKGKGKLTFMEGIASFELGDLLKASAEGLGKGNFGNSYKAMLDDGRAVVVKRLRDLKPLSGDEFMKQVMGLAELKHPNLLPLLAYYYSKDEKFLVYKFAANGNLYNRLHGGRGTKDRIPFRWRSRLAVARGVARALEYLHLNPNSQAIIPHANLKSSNILLDENDVVLVSDYGLTSIIATPIAAQRMVSFKSPEFQTSKRVSKKSDIWSFGSLLLELLTGRICVHSAPKEANGVDLCSWVHRAVREEWTAEIFDLEISAQRSAYSGMVTLLQTAIRCCHKLPDKRPEISEMVRELENVKSVLDSEEDEDLSIDRSSITDDSLSEASIIVGDER